MSKRFIIWIVVAIVGIAVVVTLQRIKRTEMEQEGHVTYHKKSGDLIQFLTQELRQYGGTITATGGVPVMRAEWRYSEDTNGFQILIAQSYKAELVRSFSSALGEPMLRDRYPQLVYKVNRLGVGVVADLQSDPIHIICLRREAQP